MSASPSAGAGGRDTPDSQPPPGVVELREDVPLKSSADGVGSAEGRCCSGGPRHIIACFAALSTAITLALVTQIYYGDFEVVPHGSVSSSAAACSRAGTDALKDGGRSFDAAAVAALCLAVVAPHRTSVDASGSLLYWEYRRSRWQSPVLAEWGGANSSDASAGAGTGERPPRLVAALATLHAQLGVLSWPRLLQPAIDIAKNGFEVSVGLATASGGKLTAGATRTELELATYLQSLQLNDSAELSAAWSNEASVKMSETKALQVGTWHMYAGGAGSYYAFRALASALNSLPFPEPEVALQSVISSLLQAADHRSWTPSGVVATGLAVVDRLDTYIAFVTGLSKPFGSGPLTAAGWTRDEPHSPLDLAPALIVDKHVCGTRYVIGAESSGALAQSVVSLAMTGVPSAVERPRVEVVGRGLVALEGGQAPAGALPALAGVALVNGTLPYPAVNLVQQRADALLSHADSRGGGHASRF